jgi:hypothetical protein
MARGKPNPFKAPFPDFGFRICKKTPLDFLLAGRTAGPEQRRGRQCGLNDNPAIVPVKNKPAQNECNLSAVVNF